MIKDVIVIGGGASGITAAIRAAERGRSVLLLEKGERIGRKILASGNGRCNLMNTGSPRYFGDPSFALRVLENCPRQEIEKFLRYYGLIMTEEAEGRVYPVSFRSSSVLDVLKDALSVSGVSVCTGVHVTAVHRNGDLFHVSTASGEIHEAARVIIACGGPAQPSAGGTDDGLSLLRQTGHRIIPPVPAMVPLMTDRKSISGLAGIRARCEVSIFRGEEELHHEEGEILFTEYGVSGICVMQCSRYAAGPDIRLEVSFLNGVFPDRVQTGLELRRRRSIYGDRSPVCLLDGVLANKISYAVMKQAGIPLRGEKAGSLTDPDLDRIADTAFRYRMMVTGTRGMEYAQVTAGGANCSEFDPSTMASAVCPGMYAAGEVLNVDGDCGGFNLMFAFAGGLLAGNAV